MGVPLSLCKKRLENLSMQLYLVVLAFATYASALPTCEECKDLIGMEQAHLLGAESIAEQQGILLAEMCPAVEDPAECEAGIQARWGDMMAALLPILLDPTTVCTDIFGICRSHQKSLVADAQCDDCMNGIFGIAVAMSLPDTQAQALEILSGDAYCAMDAECVAFAEAVLFPALTILSDTLAGKAGEECCEVANLCCA